MFGTKKYLLFAAMAGIVSLPVWAQELPSEGPVPTTALINVQSKTESPLNTAALKLEVNGHAAPISSVTPVTSEGAQVAILIDDGLRGNFGVQLSQVKDFIRSLPANTQVLVGYMENGTVRHQGGFTTDHESAAGQVRLTFSEAGISGSPYFCLSDFVKHWPAQGGGARMVLMLTNGVDPYNGSTSILNQDSPYVQHAQDDAQRAGVAVYSIYYPDSGFRGARGSFSGQSYLQQVASATGAESFYQGPITPVELTPYLNQFRKAIAESYLITFDADTTHEKGNTLVNIKVKSEQGGMKVHAPAAVHPGLAEQASE